MKNKTAHHQLGSQFITEALRKIHTEDVFIDECKDGPSAGTTHSRIDAWAMNKSWSKLKFTGYEIKCSRSDFRQDDKWHAYLPLCNQLFFVCPKGMIEVSEVPGAVGLKYVHPSGHVTIAKKADHRDVEPPMELFCYILMCRVRVVDATFYAPAEKVDKLSFYREWLNEKEEKQEVGYQVGRRLYQIHTHMKSENQRLRSRISFIEKSEKILNEMGIRDHWNSSDQTIREQVCKFMSGIPDGFIDQLRQMERVSRELGEKLQPKKADAPDAVEVLNPLSR